MRLALITVLLAGCGMRPHASFTPLADASRAGDVVAIRTLISQGADPDAIAGNNSWTPLMHAIHTNQIKSVQALLDGGADPNKGAGDAFTPLLMAAGYGYTDIVELLLHRGPNPHVPGADGPPRIVLAGAGLADHRPR